MVKSTIKPNEANLVSKNHLLVIIKERGFAQRKEGWKRQNIRKEKDWGGERERRDKECVSDSVPSHIRKKKRNHTLLGFAQIDAKSLPFYRAFCFKK